LGFCSNLPAFEASPLLVAVFVSLPTASERMFPS
jgi:hypothetical protein